jgi:hypothetical protein
LLLTLTCGTWCLGFLGDGGFGGLCKEIVVVGLRARGDVLCGTGKIRSLHQQGVSLKVTFMAEHLKTLEEIEREGLPGLAEVLRQEGLDAVRYVLWDATGWLEDYALAPAYSSGATNEQKRVGWEMFVFIEKILVTVLHEVLKQQAQETMEVLSQGPEGLYE